MDCDDTEKVLWPSGFRLEKSSEGVNPTARNGGTTETSILIGIDADRLGGLVEDIHHLLNGRNPGDGFF